MKTLFAFGLRRLIFLKDNFANTFFWAAFGVVAYEIAKAFLV